MSINPVRYPGGKGSKKIVDRVLSLYPKDYFKDKLWVEPFCGGCGLGLSLLERGEVSKVLFNDNDPRISVMWHAIIDESDRLVDCINDTDITIDLFWTAKEKANDPSADAFNRGFYTYCLNRMCRSGYIDGGVIGGNDQSGNYKCDCRFNKTTLTKYIKRLGKLAQDGHIMLTEGLDAITFLTHHDNYFDDAAFLYIDPPYYAKGAACYREGVSHEELAKVLLNKDDEGLPIVKNEWLLSYDDCSAIRRLYDGCKFSSLEIVYSNNTQTRGKTGELLIQH